MKPSLLLLIGLLTLLSPAAGAATDSTQAQKLYEQVTPSLVAVQYTWEHELGRQEVIGAGVVVGEDGTVILPLAVANPGIPDEQMKDFKIIVPREDADPDEIDATFIGRDDRTNLAFVRAKPGKSSPAGETRKWKPIKFEDVSLQVGDPVVSVGVLPKMAGYKSYLMLANVAAMLRGEVPQVMVSGGGLGVIGSPVFNSAGKAVGYVNLQTAQQILLNDRNNPLAAVNNPPKFFVPARDFLQSFEDPPVAGQSMKLPWMGVVQLTGLRKEVAEFYGLGNQPAVQIGDVIKNTPAEKAGLKAGWIIVKMNGQPLERGDEPEELPQILRRKVLRMKVGSQVTFQILEEPNKPLKDVTLTLDEQPKRPNLAQRWYDDRLGLGVREIVFSDTYRAKLPADQKGVVVSVVKPSSSAETARVKMNDIVTQMNGKPVEDLEQFKTDFQQFRKEKPREAVILEVTREGNTQVIRIEPPQ